MPNIEFMFRPMSKWPRAQTPAAKRRRSPFGVTLDKCYRLLKYELGRLQAENPVVIQIAIGDDEIRLDGLPRAGASPKWPGVILSFRSAKLGPMEYACDACRDWPDNIRAICLTLERLRLIDLYGCTSRSEQYTGWRALPAPLITAPPMTIEEAAAFIAQVTGSNRQQIIENAESARISYRVATTLFHPDKNNGQPRPEWARLQAAKEVLDRHFQTVNDAR